MSESNKTLEDIVEQPRKRGRPRKEVSRAEENRPTRVPVSGNRDILTVLGKDPNYEYRWVVDTDEGGHRIFRFLQGGYEFATTEQGLKIGQAYVYKSQNVGSIIRIPAGRSPGASGQYEYLMRLHKDYYNVDQDAKEQRIRNKEKLMTRPSNEGGAQDKDSMGQYGEVDNESEFVYHKQ